MFILFIKSLVFTFSQKTSHVKQWTSFEFESQNKLTIVVSFQMRRLADNFLLFFKSFNFNNCNWSVIQTQDFIFLSGIIVAFQVIKLFSKSTGTRMRTIITLLKCLVAAPLPNCCDLWSLFFQNQTHISISLSKKLGFNLDINSCVLCSVVR